MEYKPLTLEKELLDHKEYELNLDESTYILSVEIYSNETILFKLNQKNILSNIQYRKEFTYENIIKELLNLKSIYTNIKEVLKLIDNSITKNRFKLVENKEKKTMSLQIKMLINEEEKESLISLPLEMTYNKEILNLLINEMNLLKNNNTNIQNNNMKKELEKSQKNFIELDNKYKEIVEKQGVLIKQNEENTLHIKELIKLNNDKDNKIKELEQKIEEKDIKTQNLETKVIKIINDNKTNTEKLINNILNNGIVNTNKLKELESKLNKLSDLNINKINEIKKDIINKEEKEEEQDEKKEKIEDKKMI